MVEGEQVLGRFTVAERIGGGGHGTVHRAWDERLCRWVAVKAVEGDAAARVLREAHAAARLNHPGIVTLYELGRQGGCAYLVTELVEGPNLRELAAAGALSDRDVAEIGAELCAALEHAHANGVVHRDLKPDNVLVRRRCGRFRRESGERALLADFGIAALADGPALTAPGQVVGTLAYMSPEQAAGEGVGPATDVYSLALTLYELWAGHNPVVRTTPAATVRAIGQPVPSLGEARPELPPQLSEALDAALLTESELRPSPQLLREALLSARGVLHPDRAVPEPTTGELPILPPELPVRPFAVLLAAGALALSGWVAGLPGLALVAAALLAPAALLLSRPTEWVLPALAPLLGLIGAAPAYLALASRHERPAARISLAALGWAWSAVAGALLGHGLGVPGAPVAAGWSGAGAVAVHDVIGALLSPTAVGVGLVWVGSTVLLGALLDSTKPAGAAVGGLLWAAGVSAALSAAGPGASPSAALAPALALAVGWAIWDRHGRPDPGPLFAVLVRWTRTDPAPEPRVVRRPPRNPAGSPIADARVRHARAGERHVRAALHGAAPGPPARSGRPRNALARR